VFQRVDELEDSTVERIVDRLEYRGTSPVFAEMRDAYLDEIGLADAERVIEIGCGTGVVARAIAKRSEFVGDLYATDLTEAFIEAAVGFAESDGVGDRIRFAVGDSNQITDVEGGYDIVVGHTLISHVADPGGLIAEAARVLRPGGRLVLFDGDYAGMVVGTGTDTELDAQVMTALTETACANPSVLRAMPRMLRDHGFELASVQDHVYSEVGNSEFFLGLAEYAALIIPGAGGLTGSDVDRWLAGLRQANADGVYFGASNYYTYIATKPAA
jgi:SAM-dependent methyltransferase